ncbi:MAG TPA: YhbY family RNA-binding protein, partial [Usitatibacter sp.]
MKLSASRRSELRAEAHTLSPVVIIGDKGLTDEVVKEIDRSLKAHELIKVRAFSDDRKARAEWMK